MAEHSSIEWTDATWNPITGCSIKSPGCRICYAMKLAGTRLKHHPSRQGLTKPSANGPVWTGEVRFNEEWITQPLHWREPRMIFVCAHGDLFHENVPDAWIDKVFAVMALAPQHTFQVLTKRSERMRKYFSVTPDQETWRVHLSVAAKHAVGRYITETFRWPLPNVWLGVSAERQQEADERIPDLLTTPAAVRFVSLEPLLGPIDLTNIGGGPVTEGGGQIKMVAHGINAITEHNRVLRGVLDWIIVGGESGDGAMPMHPAWVRSLRDQCAAAGLGDRFFFKQWGAWVPICALGDAAIDKLYHPARKRDPEGARKCLVPQRILHADGTWWSWAAPGAFAAGTQAMQMFETGKKRAGRLLDGVAHNGMPGRNRDGHHPSTSR